MTSLEERVAALEDQVFKLSKRLGAWEPPAFHAPPSWHLSKEQSRLLYILVNVNGGCVESCKLYDAMYGGRVDGGPDSSVLRSLLRELRSKLKPHGITIRTVRGTGVELPPDAREHLHAVAG